MEKERKGRSERRGIGKERKEGEGKKREKKGGVQKRERREREERERRGGEGEGEGERKRESENTKTRHSRHVLGVRDIVGGREGAEHQKRAKMAHYRVRGKGVGADQRETRPGNTPRQACFSCFRGEK